MMQKNYIVPRTEIVSVLQKTNLLAGSGNMPIGGGESQEIAW